MSKKKKRIVGVSKRDNTRGKPFATPSTDGYLREELCIQPCRQAYWVSLPYSHILATVLPPRFLESTPTWNEYSYENMLLYLINQWKYRILIDKRRYYLVHTIQCGWIVDKKYFG